MATPQAPAPTPALLLLCILAARYARPEPVPGDVMGDAVWEGRAESRGGRGPASRVSLLQWVGHPGLTTEHPGHSGVCGSSLANSGPAGCSVLGGGTSEHQGPRPNPGHPGLTWIFFFYFGNLEMLDLVRVFWGGGGAPVFVTETGYLNEMQMRR